MAAMEENNPFGDPSADDNPFGAPTDDDPFAPRPDTTPPAAPLQVEAAPVAPPQTNLVESHGFTAAPADAVNPFETMGGNDDPFATQPTPFPAETDPLAGVSEDIDTADASFHLANSTSGKSNPPVVCHTAAPCDEGQNTVVDKSPSRVQHRQAAPKPQVMEENPFGNATTEDDPFAFQDTPPAPAAEVPATGNARPAPAALPGVYHPAAPLPVWKAPGVVPNARPVTSNVDPYPTANQGQYAPQPDYGNAQQVPSLSHPQQFSQQPNGQQRRDSQPNVASPTTAQTPFPNQRPAAPLHGTAAFGSPGFAGQTHPGPLAADAGHAHPMSLPSSPPTSQMDLLSATPAVMSNPQTGQAPTSPFHPPQSYDQGAHHQWAQHHFHHQHHYQLPQPVYPHQHHHHIHHQHHQQFQHQPAFAAHHHQHAYGVPPSYSHQHYHHQHHQHHAQPLQPQYTISDPNHHHHHHHQGFGAAWGQTPNAMYGDQPATPVSATSSQMPSQHWTPGTPHAAPRRPAMQRIRCCPVALGAAGTMVTVSGTFVTCDTVGRTLRESGTPAGKAYVQSLDSIPGPLDPSTTKVDDVVSALSSVDAPSPLQLLLAQLVRKSKFEWQADWPLVVAAIQSAGLLPTAADPAPPGSGLSASAPDPAAVPVIQQYIVLGKRAEALKVALDSGQHVHALLIALMCDKETYVSTVGSILRGAVIAGTPLSQAYKMFTDLPLDAPAQQVQPGDNRLADWLPHAITLCSNYSDPTLEGLVTLGDSLAQARYIMEAHFCYLLAQLCPAGQTPENAEQLKVKYTLLGGLYRRDQRRTLLLNPKTFIMTEALEYARRKQNDKYVRPQQIPFKAMMGMLLIECGLVDKGRLYLDNIAKMLPTPPKNAPNAAANGGAQGALPKDNFTRTLPQFIEAQRSHIELMLKRGSSHSASSGTASTAGGGLLGWFGTRKAADKAPEKPPAALPPKTSPPPETTYAAAPAASSSADANAGSSSATAPTSSKKTSGGGSSGGGGGGWLPTGFFRRKKDKDEEKAKPMILDDEAPPEYDPVTGRFKFQLTDEEKEIESRVKAGPPKMPLAAPSSVPSGAAGGFTADSAPRYPAPGQHDHQQLSQTPFVPTGAPAPFVPAGAPAPFVPAGAPAPFVPSGAPAPLVPGGSGAMPPPPAGAAKRPPQQAKYVDMFNA
jgi:hypothetical protein